MWKSIPIKSCFAPFVQLVGCATLSTALPQLAVPPAQPLGVCVCFLLFSRGSTGVLRLLLLLHSCFSRPPAHGTPRGFLYQCVIFSYCRCAGAAAGAATVAVATASTTAVASTRLMLYRNYRYSSASTIHNTLLTHPFNAQVLIHFKRARTKGERGEKLAARTVSAAVLLCRMRV